MAASIVLFLIVFVLYSINKAKLNGVPLDEFSKHLGKRIPALMKTYSIPGVSIAVIKNGKFVWSDAYGFADIEHKRKMKIETICRVQSISKSVTAWGVMKLVEQGKVELDAPVKEYVKKWHFPETKYSEGKITVKQLLSHTSGMPLGNFTLEYSPEGFVPSLRDNLFKEAQLIKEPGTKFLYSNVGFNLLELLIEEVTGKEFAKFMEEEVLVPLGMDNSSFNWSKDLKNEVPMGYDLKSKPVPVYVYPEKASGGLFANVEDIAKFVIAGMIYSDSKKDNILMQKSIKELYTPVIKIPGLYGLVSEAYGFGHFIDNISQGKQAVFHGGQGHGWMTHFHSVPETGDGIVILTNSQRSWPMISNILKDWTDWCGFSSIGMVKISQGIMIIWILIAIILILCISKGFLLTTEIVHGYRRFALLSSGCNALRLFQGGISIFLLGVLLWCKNQDYLLVSAIFPVADKWLGYSAFGFAAVLLLSAIFPKY